MKKKVISVLAAGTMAAVVLTGCSSSSSTSSSGGSSANASKASSTSSEAGTQAASGEVSIDFDEDPYEVAIQFVGLNESNNDLPAVEDALNEILKQKVNATVDIQPLFIGDMGTTTSMGIAGGEKLDIVCVGMTYSMSTAVSDGVLLPLDDLIAERGPAVAKVTENVSAAQKVNGQTYAITGYPYAAMSGGFAYNKTMADKYGIDMHDGMTLDELTDVGATLKENGVYLTSFSNSVQLNAKFMNSWDVYGSSGDYGVIKDAANSTTIENIYASDEIRDYFKHIKTWFDNGYLPQDQMTDTTSVQQHFANQKVFGTTTAYTPDQVASWTNPSFETGIVKLSDPILETAGVGEQMWGIAATCERPDKAMDVLNVIYSDPEVQNLIQYGIEGQDYVRVDGTQNVITYTGSASNEDHSGYYTAFCHFGDPLTRYVVAPLTDEYTAELKTFNDEAAKAKSFGYQFDASEYSTEAAAISSVLTAELPQLNAGQVEDVDAAVDQLVADLQDAGIDTVIAGNQEQLDAYLANQ